MTFYWDTERVVVNRSGAGWTVDVTAAQLDQDLSLKDFVVLINDIPDALVNYNKTTPTLLTYVGPSIVASVVEVRRLTPTSPRSLVEYQQRFSSADYNRELERNARRIAEFRSLGVGIGSSQINVNAAPYGLTWSADESNAPSRSAVYAKVESVEDAYEAADAALQGQLNTKASLVSPAFTGTPTAPTTPTDTSNTQLATTQYVKDNRSASEIITNDALNLKAPLASPALTGVPTAPTPNVGVGTTQLATGALVKQTQGAFVAQVINQNASAQPSNAVVVQTGGTSLIRNTTTGVGNYNGGNGLVTVPVSGFYRITVSDGWEGGSVSVMLVFARLNGGATEERLTSYIGSGLSGYTDASTRVYLLTAGDTVSRTARFDYSAAPATRHNSALIVELIAAT